MKNGKIEGRKMFYFTWNLLLLVKSNTKRKIPEKKIHLKRKTRKKTGWKIKRKYEENIKQKPFVCDVILFWFGWENRRFLWERD